MTAASPTGATGGIGATSSTHLLVEKVSGKRRPIAIDELKALCSFPADFELPGSRATARKLLLNCVPPLLAYWWADRLSNLLQASVARLSELGIAADLNLGPAAIRARVS